MILKMSCKPFLVQGKPYRECIGNTVIRFSDTEKGTNRKRSCGKEGKRFGNGNGKLTDRVKFERPSLDLAPIFGTLITCG